MQHLVNGVSRFRSNVARGWDRAFNSRVVRATAGAAESYFLPAGYRYWVAPRYYNDIAPDACVVSQPDVYGVVEGIADALDSRRVLDLGCGKAGKLAPMAVRYGVVGWDFGSNLAYCRSEHRWGTWLEADLDSDEVLEVDRELCERAVVVSSDVVEHLCCPANLISSIRRMLGTADAAVLSTPDRVRTWGADHRGPPPNRCHVREWTLGEFRQLLEWCDLTVAYIGYTRSNTLDVEGKTILAVCTGTALPADKGHLAGSVAARVSQDALSIASGRSELSGSTAAEASGHGLDCR